MSPRYSLSIARELFRESSIHMPLETLLLTIMFESKFIIHNGWLANLSEMQDNEVQKSKAYALGECVRPQIVRRRSVEAWFARYGMAAMLVDVYKQWISH